MEKEIQELLAKMGVDKEIFNEDFVKQLGLLLEAKTGNFKKQIESELQDENQKELAEFKEELVEQLDQYLNLFVEKYIEDNKDVIHEAVEVDTARKVLQKFDHLVDEFNVELSEDNVSNEIEMDGMKSQLNSIVNEKISLEREVTELRKQKIVSEFVNQHLNVDSEKDSFSRLAESFEYEDEDSYREKLEYLKENISITTDTTNDDNLEDKEMLENQTKDLKESEETSEDMKEYLQVLENSS